MIKLGDKVKDKISGFTGIVISVHEFLYGCRRISVQKISIKNAKYEDAQVFDEPQLKLIKIAAYKIEENLDKNGGPRAIPKARITGNRKNIRN